VDFTTPKLAKTESDFVIIAQKYQTLNYNMMMHLMRTLYSTANQKANKNFRGMTD